MSRSFTAFRTFGLLIIATFAAVALSVSPARAGDVITQCIAASDKGLDLRKQGKLIDARRVLAACASTSCGADISDTCQKGILEINNALPSIVFEVKDVSARDLTNVELTIDGTPYAEKLAGTAIMLDPGDHEFKFSVAGQDAVVRHFVLLESAKDRREPIVVGSAPAPLAASIAARTTRASESPIATNMETAAVPADHTTSGSSGSSQKTIGLVVGGVGLAGIAVGSIFGGIAITKWSSAHSSCNATNCPQATRGLAVSDHDSASSSALLSSIAFGVGAAGIVGATVLWITAPSGCFTSPAATARVQVTPLIGARSGGIVMRGAF